MKLGKVLMLTGVAVLPLASFADDPPWTPDIPDFSGSVQSLVATVGSGIETIGPYVFGALAMLAVIGFTVRFFAKRFRARMPA